MNIPSVPQFGGVVQFAYTTSDIRQGMRDYTARLGIGPWFLTGPFSPKLARYRGQPTDISLSLAVGFAGHVMVELIEQHNDVPSVYRETVSRRGHGFHHWGICSADFDADLARYSASGYQEVFSDISPRGVRIVYVEGPGELPGMIQIIESTPQLQDIYLSYYEAARNWDGSDPIRVWPGRQPVRR